MALSTRRGGRTRFTLVLLILTSITLLTLDFRGFSPLSSVRSAVLDAFEPVGNFASDTMSPVRDAWNGAFDYDNVQSENEALRQRIDELEGQAGEEAEDRASLGTERHPCRDREQEEHVDHRVGDSEL
jgi:cell shape-determining protein MreC